MFEFLAYEEGNHIAFHYLAFGVLATLVIDLSNGHIRCLMSSRTNPTCLLPVEGYARLPR